MTTIGIIGAGNIGSNVGRAALAHGYEVVIANSRGPETLSELVAELGDGAAAGTVAEASERGDLVLVAIPLKAIGDIDPAALKGKTVIDANNYYPQRDGSIAELDDESSTTAELLQRRLPDSKVVKAFNHIAATQIVEHARPAGTAGRRALALAGDDQVAKDAVAAFIDTIGFDTLDLGPLAEGWRVQRDTPAYVQQFTRDELASAVTQAKRYRDM